MKRMGKWLLMMTKRLYKKPTFVVILILIPVLVLGYGLVAAEDSGMVTIALASLLIGRTLMGKGGIFNRAVGMVLGAFVFRLVYTIALRMNMPAYMLKLVSSTIVVIAIFLPYMKRQMPLMRRAMAGKGKGGN